MVMSYWTKRRKIEDKYNLHLQNIAQTEQNVHAGPGVQTASRLNPHAEDQQSKQNEIKENTQNDSEVVCQKSPTTKIS